MSLPQPSTTSYEINSFSYLAAKSLHSLTNHHPTITDSNLFRQLISNTNFDKKT